MPKKIDTAGLKHFKDKENAMVASEFSASKSYAIGEYVYYKGTLYKFKAAHAAGAWTNADVDAVKLADDVSVLKESLAYNTVSGDVVWFDDAQEAPLADISVDDEARILNRIGTNVIFNNAILSGETVGVKSTANNDGSLTITGTVQTDAWVYFGQYKTLSELGLQVGMPITASINDVSPKAGLSIWFEDSNGNRLQMLETQYSDNNIASTIIPENTVRLRILLYPQALTVSAIGTVFNVTLFPQLEIGKSATPFQKGVKKQYSISNGTPAEQVTTLEGKNSFLADVGNVSIKYLLDIKKYVDNKIAEIQATILENIGG